MNPKQDFLCPYITLSAFHHCFFICANGLFKTRKGLGPKLNKVRSHFLPNRTFIHLSTDVEELLFNTRKVRPGHRHLKGSIVGVSAKIKRCIKISTEAVSVEFSIP